MVHLGLTIVMGDDREGGVCGRRGRVDEVSGEVEGLTGICATRVDDEMSAVTRKVLVSSEYEGWKVKRADPARLGARWGAAAEQQSSRACRTRGGKRGKKRLGAGKEPCRDLVPSECGLSSVKEKKYERDKTDCCWRLSLREHLISQPG